MGIDMIRKRDGREVPFDQDKIEQAIFASFQASGSARGHETSRKLTEEVVRLLENNENISAIPSVEQVQDTVEQVLMRNGFTRTAKSYILYRAERSRVREMNSRLMRTFGDIVFKDASESDIKRENANINGDTAMGAMLKFGSEGAKQYYEKYVMDPRFGQAHMDGDIHIHDMDFYTLTTTCCQIELKSLFKGGFSTGHGYLREPQDITSYAALACIAIQANQNDQHGGQAIVDFDYGMAPGVKKTFIKRYRMNLSRALELLLNDAECDAHANELVAQTKAENLEPTLEENADHRARMAELLTKYVADEQMIARILEFTQRRSEQETDKATYQAMEALIHNLNTMNSRAGAQVPFSSINYGTDTSAEGRCIIRELLKSTYQGVGNGETAIFPIQIWKKKRGVSYLPEDRNYDLYQLACKVTARRFFPNFLNLDATFNQSEDWKADDPKRYQHEVATMGCRTRVFENRFGPKTSIGRGNISFSTINIVRLGIECMNIEDKEQRIARFFAKLDSMLEVTARQLHERMEFQKTAFAKQFPLLMSALWIGSEKLKPNDTIASVINHAEKGLHFANISEPLLHYRFFADSVRKNSIEVGWHRMKIGLRGCRRLHLSFIAYIGVCIPFVRSLLPYPLNVYFQGLMNRMNPRKMRE